MAYHPFDSERVLVTGGAGFLGSHLCDRLLEKGHYVICLDNYFTGQKRNIFHLLENPHFEVIRHDLVNPVFLEVDQIYNMACPASPVHYQYNPVRQALWVLFTCSVLPKESRQRSYRLQQARYTGILPCIPKMKATGEM